MKHNLLETPLCRLDRPDGSRVWASLPQIYEALMADEVVAFPAQRPYQGHPFHAFLVQAGAMAMHRAGLAEPPEEAGTWGKILRELTPDWSGDEPWHLVVEDMKKPAFMQPPTRSQEREAQYKPDMTTPDELDILVTAKDHDLKSAVAEEGEIDDWVFALITLQTMAGFDGQGNYGISRMNGGWGNRPAFSLAPAIGGIGVHVRRDIVALLEFRPKILDDYDHYPDSGGIGLLWTQPWDGTADEALQPNALDPLYIDVCRPVRLRSDDEGDMYAIRGTSKAARVDAKALNGRTGDPWAPIDRRDKKGPKVLTLSVGGFHYQRVTDYLASGDIGKPYLLKPTVAEARSTRVMRLVARALVRGQGKTEGYYERSFMVRHQLKSAMLGGAAADDLATISKRRIEDVGKVQRILSHAIQVFAAHGDAAKIKPEHRTLASPWLKRLDELVDDRFFEALQDEFEAGEDEREAKNHEWLMNGSDGVVDHAHSLLLDATEALPCPSIYRYKAQVNATGLFWGRLRGGSGLPELFKEDNTNAGTEVGDDDDN